MNRALVLLTPDVIKYAVKKNTEHCMMHDSGYMDPLKFVTLTLHGYKLTR